MATLSFNCPKCEKVHARIKPEMAGHKVRCQCGCVFRLGPKSEKQPGVADDIKRRRAIKARKLATRQNLADIKITKSNSNSSGAPASLIKPVKSTDLNSPRILPEVHEPEFAEPEFAESPGNLNNLATSEPILENAEDEEMIALEEDDEIFDSILPADMVELVEESPKILDTNPNPVAEKKPRDPSKPRFKM